MVKIFEYPQFILSLKFLEKNRKNSEQTLVFVPIFEIYQQKTRNRCDKVSEDNR